MEKEIFYMSIGYPIGLTKNTKGERLFTVDVGNEFIGLYNDCYLIWKYCFFDVKRKEDIINNFVSQKIMADLNVALNLEKLVDEGLLLKFDFSSMDTTIKALEEFCPVRNGFGVGMLSDELTFRIVNQGQNFDVSPEDYHVWKHCNNKKSILEIIKLVQSENSLLEKEAKTVVMNSVLRLKTIDLLRI